MKPSLGSALVVLCACVLAAHGQTPSRDAAASGPPGVTVIRDIAYAAGGHARQKLDLYLPKGGKDLPLIISIHGGAFRMGSKEDGIPMDYLGLGYAVASINYRLSGDAVWPAQIEDCKAAVRWLRANAQTYGIAPDRFAAWGSSAGGHLAAMLGTAGWVNEYEVGGNLDVTSRVQAVVDYFGPTDFLQMDAHRLPNGQIHDAADSPESLLVGGAIQENKEKVARANPITFITKDAPPILICHGDADPLVPHHQSVLLEAALRQAGVPVTFYTVKGGGHGRFNDPKVPELTREFLARYLRPSVSSAASAAERRPLTVVLREDIFTDAPFGQCHASTIAETESGLVAAWFGGRAEGDPHVGIWLSRQERPGWTGPVEVARGIGEGGEPEPCWNPVLIYPKGGPLLLFYKVGPSPSRWRGMMTRSGDGGRTWAEPRPLPKGIIGPVKNHPLELSGGTLLCGSSTEDDGWRVHFEMTGDKGQTWRKTPPLNDAKTVGLIQPALLRTGADSAIALMRSNAGRIYAARGENMGATWSVPEPTAFPNPNSGIDAVTLRDGRHVLVYNPVTEGRGVLAVAVSEDGRNWRRCLTLEEEEGAEFSYPAVIETRDGFVHIVFTWKRLRIRHIVLDPSALKAGPAVEAGSDVGRGICVMETSLGTLTFELFEAEAPRTAAQFKDLVEKGFYDGKDFYRVVRGHVIQAGGGDAPKLPPEFNLRPHVVGALGLGRVGDEWSGDSEIYVCVAPRPHLDGRYTVFGQLVEGFDVLEKIAAVPVKEKWEGPEGKMAMHMPIEPVVIRKARIKRGTQYQFPN